MSGRRDERRAGTAETGTGLAGPVLLDVAQTAELLNTSPRFVRRLVQERRIPYLKIGRYVRFDPEQLRSVTVQLVGGVRSVPEWLLPVGLIREGVLWQQVV